MSDEFKICHVPVRATDRWTLIQGEAFALLRALPDASVDAICTDPPYSSGGATRGDRMIAPSKKYEQNDVKVGRPDFAGDNRDQRGYLVWCTLWLAECLRVAKPGSPICIFTDWRQLPITTDALQAGGWVWRGIVPWDKTEGCRPQMGRFAAQCEYVVWGSAGALAARTDVGCLPGFVRESVKQDDKHHLTGKPTATMEAVVKICPPGGLVLDPFAGSATTGIACIRTGRRFLGFEIDEYYATDARTRLQAEVEHSSLLAEKAGQVALFGGLAQDRAADTEAAPALEETIGTDGIELK